MTSSQLTDDQGDGATTVLRTLRRGIHHLRWFVRGVLGEDAYDKYREHYATLDHEDHPPMMTEREFWRDRTDRQDANPEGRCC
ncbi:MAG: hypothetical protein JWQ43_2988 [Glaciihabitans sp.]|nr:hypothetical protein [Glaciihabitans sp.]